MKKMIFTLISAAAMLLSSCASDDNSLSDKTLSAADEYVKPIGRTYLAEDGTRWLTQSASGIEFRFTGTEASFDLIGDINAGTEAGKDGYARYAVYVDGEKVSDGMMDEASKKVQVFSSDTEKETTVKILKLSECTNSIFGISGINVKSVGKPVPTESKKLKIEFIGDSITCGYGVDDEDRDHHFKTDTEDATKAYAYKTAALLDADYSLVSYSGHGIISGYTGDGKKQPLQIVPKYYTKLGRSYSTTDACPVSKIDWDFNSFKPDVIVINLGTNDSSYVKGNSDKQREYIDGYVAFLEVIRENNPDAHILCTLGIMGNDLYPCIETAVSEYTEKTGDTKVSSMMFDVQSPEDGWAADWHPTDATHTKAAAKLAEEIKKIVS